MSNDAVDGNDTAILDREVRHWATALTADQRRAILRWQGRDRFYERVQAVMTLGIDDPEAVDAAGLLLAAATHKLQRSYTTWRGVRSSIDAYGLRSGELGQLIGTSVRINRFVSVSLRREVVTDEFTVPEMSGGAVLSRMMLGAGTMVGWLASVGRPDSRYQAEVLLRPGNMQRIVGVDTSGDIPTLVVEVAP
ncbi:hypothetical protein HH308_27250 [Gordonia sp. TBRC 11910]|uniref:Uncharacterized protein n=1 Tax=Gordonia asplenii TaxID=2725283 RepID=A0A848LBG6_9ACTN|nr:hypothetical protein [Gordonia asplenii]NMO04928.1 hypothetical protein [Gordonia asplenii]